MDEDERAAQIMRLGVPGVALHKPHSRKDINLIFYKTFNYAPQSF